MNKNKKSELQYIANMSVVRNHLYTLVNSGKSLNKDDYQSAGHLVTKLDRLVFGLSSDLFKDEVSTDVDDGLNLAKKIRDAKAKLLVDSKTDELSVETTAEISAEISAKVAEKPVSSKKKGSVLRAKSND